MTDRLNIAIFIEQKLQIGGGFQQSLISALQARDLKFDLLNLIFIVTNKENVTLLKRYNINAICINLSYFDKIMMLMRRKIYLPQSLKKSFLLSKRNKLEKFLDKLDIDLLYFTSPSTLPFYLSDYNFIYTLWDMSHRDDVEFPENRNNFVFEKREELNHSILPKAVAILVDSEVAAVKLSLRYGIDIDRILIMPFLPALNSHTSDDDYEEGFFDVKKKYDIAFDYVFYPAQFWSHKNHIFILNGIKLLEDMHGIKLGAIFSGSDRGNRQFIMEYARSAKLKNRIIFAGFVSDSDMPYFYRQSLALVMPTYFGPTNMPPLEAFQLGVPVIYSNIDGAKEQLDEAAFLLDINDEMSFVESILSLKNQQVKEDMIKKGRTQLKLIIKKRDRAEEALCNIFIQYAQRQRSWKKRL